MLFSSPVRTVYPSNSWALHIVESRPGLFQYLYMAESFTCNPFNITTSIKTGWRGYFIGIAGENITLDQPAEFLILWLYYGGSVAPTVTPYPINAVPAAPGSIIYVASSSNGTFAVRFNTDKTTITVGSNCKGTAFVVTSFGET